MKALFTRFCLNMLGWANIVIATDTDTLNQVKAFCVLEFVQIVYDNTAKLSNPIRKKALYSKCLSLRMIFFKINKCLCPIHLKV